MINFQTLNTALMLRTEEELLTGGNLTMHFNRLNLFSFFFLGQPFDQS